MRATSKVCAACGVEKSLSCFSRKSGKSLQPKCKTCAAAWAREYRRENPLKAAESDRSSKAKRRAEITARQRLRNTGFTQRMFDVVFTTQSGACAICQIDLSGLPPRAVCADHCHTTKTTRGILCAKCNLVLGLVKDDPERLRAAAEYLELHRGCPA